MNDPINDGGPAFPHDGRFTQSHPGMSLRAWLAGQALAGMDHGDVGADDAALWAVEAADAVIKQLEAQS